MLHYRALIMRDHPGVRLSQHVIVMRGGRVTGHDDPESHGFRLDLDVVYLRDLDPQVLQSDVWLAPLMALARDREQRAAALKQAIGLIHKEAGALAGEWIALATTLADIRLDETTIHRVVEEARMTWSIGEQILSRTSFGTDLRHLGREEGREEGRRALMLALLENRFGAGPEAERAADRLAAWSDAAAAVRAVDEAVSLDQVLDLSSGDAR